MEQVVVSIEALRCYQCRQVMDPRVPSYRRQMKTAVSVNQRSGTTNTYELVDVCQACNEALTKLENDIRQNEWWAKFWVWAFVGNLIFTAFVPVSIYPWVVGLLVRSWWKRRAKRQQRLTPGQTAQQVPQTMAPSAAEERTKSNTSS